MSAQLVGSTLALGAGGGVSALPCASAGNCSAGGGLSDDSGTRAFLAEEVNGTWGDAQPVPGMTALGSQGDEDIPAVSCPATGVCNAGGWYLATGVSQPFLVHGRTDTVTLTSPGDQATTAGGPVDLQLRGTSSEGLTLSYAASGLPPGVTIDSATVLITGWPVHLGTYHAAVTATDSAHGSESVSFSWAVNGAPDRGPSGHVRVRSGGKCLTDVGNRSRNYCWGGHNQQWHCWPCASLSPVWRPADPDTRSRCFRCSEPLKASVNRRVRKLLPAHVHACTMMRPHQQQRATLPVRGSHQSEEYWGIMGRSGARVTARRTAQALSDMARAGSRAGYRTLRFTGRTVHRMTHASGAGRTGLANLIELTGAGSAGDAFVTVALADTLFFSASLDQARGRVALALVVTMAPFAVLAPLIGPMLDRVQQGRRFVLAGTLVARGLLCWGMAGAVQYNDALTLLPAAFAVLVLQKAYGVTRAAITPRLLPREITLVTANARISMASLVAGTVAVGTAAGIDLAAGGGDSGAAWVLRVGTFVYLAAAALSFRVPEQVDIPEQRREPLRPGRPGPAKGAQRGPAPARPGPEPGGAPGTRAGRREGGHATAPQGRWRTLSRVGPIVGEAIRVNATLRAFSGFMVFFLAFLLRIEHFPGVSDKIALGAMVAAAGAGGFLGTAAGSALRPVRPHLITFGMLAAATVTAGLCAAFFGLWAALVVALVAAFGQVLGKLTLDSTVQNQIGEEVRSSTFAASETLHQLSWVAGALAGLAMSFTSSGVAGLAVAAVALAISLTVLLGQRRRRALAAR